MIALLLQIVLVAYTQLVIAPCSYSYHIKSKCFKKQAISSLSELVYTMCNDGVDPRLVRAINKMIKQFIFLYLIYTHNKYLSYKALAPTLTHRFSWVLSRSHTSSQRLLSHVTTGICHLAVVWCKSRLLCQNVSFQ